MTAAWFRSTSGGDNPPCHVVGHATAARRYQAAFVILDSLGLLFREAHPLLEDLPARSRERGSDDGGGGFDGFREISVRTELSTKSLTAPALACPPVHTGFCRFLTLAFWVDADPTIFAYEATLSMADVIRRAGSDEPAAIQRAFKTTTMQSLLGGGHALDDHNHTHTDTR